MLLTVGSQAFAATSAVNGATLAPPPGITDSSGGCDAAVPPNCTGNNAATARVDVWAAAASKRAAPASGSAVLPGSRITYTLSLNITGAATTEPIALTDTLGTGLSFGAVNANTGGFSVAPAGSRVVYTLPAGAAVGLHTVEYTALVAPNATGSVGNVVVGANCTAASPCSTTHPIGELTASKALVFESGSQPGVAEAGETLRYAITLTNNSATPATYNLTDTLSAGLTYARSSNGGVNAGASTTWANLAVPANGTLVVTLEAVVASPITTAAVSNLIKPTGGNDPNCPSVGTCVVTPTEAAVTVAKAANPRSGSTVVPGQTVAYTLTATVSGGTTTRPIVLTDTLGAGLAFGRVTSAGAFTAGGVGNARTFTLPIGTAAGTYAVTYIAAVQPGAANGSVNNVVTGAGCTTQGGCATDHPVGTIGIGKRLVSESGSRPGIAEAGETLGYEITLVNPSSVQVAFALTDVLSPGLNFVSASDGGIAAGRTVSWPSLDVPANGLRRVVVTTSVESPLTVAAIRNLAKPTGSSDPSCPSATCVVTPTASSVTIAKRASPASGSTVVTGQILTYTVTATVTGGATTAPTVLTDTLAPGLTFGAVTNAGNFIAGGAGNARTFTLPTGTVAGSYVVSYTATVTGASGTRVNNLVAGADCATPGGCGTDHPVGQVSLVKSLIAESGSYAGIAEPGEALTYQITLTNPSTLAVDYDLTDTLGVGLSYVSSSPAGANAGATTTWRLQIQPNSSLRVTLSARVITPIVVSSVRNLAKPTGNSDPACPSDGNCIVTPTQASVVVAKSANPPSGATVVPGQVITYTVTATVSGGVTTTPTVLNDLLGAGLRFGAVTSPGRFVAGGGVGNARTFTLPAGTPSGQYPVSYTATVLPTARNGTVDNAVTGAPCQGGSVCATDHVVGSIALRKELVSESGTLPGVAEPGETIGYRITLTNPTTADVSYDLTDRLGTGLRFQAASNNGVNSGLLTTWNALRVPANGSFAVTLTAVVDTPVRVTSVSNLAKPSGTPDPACPTAGACIVTPTAPNIVLVKTLTGETGTRAGIAEAGETLTYTLRLTNSGGVEGNYDLTDVLGAGLEYVSSSNNGTASGQTITWPRFTVPAAGNLAVTVRARVLTPIASPTLRNIAKPAGGPDPGCPSATCVDTPTDATVSLVKSVSSESGARAGIAEPGETIGYALTLTNTGGTVASYDLSDILGPGLRYLSSTDGGVNNGTTTTWTALPVPANGIKVVTLRAVVDSPLTQAMVRNLAKPTGGGDPPCPSAGCIDIPTPPSFTLAKRLRSESGSQPGIAEAGETLVYDITVSNAGGTAAPYDLTDVLGAGLSFVSATEGGANDGRTTTWRQLDVPALGSRTVSLTARVDAPITTTSVVNLAKPTGGTDPQCPSATCAEIPTEARVAVLKRLVAESGRQAGVAEAGETLRYAITFGNTGGSPFNAFRFVENVPLGATLRSVEGAAGFGGPVTGPASVALQVPAVPAAGSTTVGVVFEVAQPVPAGVANILNLVNGPDVDPACGANCAVTTPVEEPSQLSVVKTAGSREAKVGDLVRYTVTVTNIGASNVVGANVIDTPPPGFSYVADSIVVNDVDGAFVLGASRYPLQIGGIDVPIGKQATISYLLRVGAGVLRGPQVNQAQSTDRNGRPNSNVATAQVDVVGDPMVDESLILGTVFDDRDGDGWQAPASLTGLRAQGGFPASAYVPGSTLLRRGDGWTSLPDASAPLLHGVDLGRLVGRQSAADPAPSHELILRQRLRQPTFTDDFVLTSDQGVTLRLDAAGRSRVEKTEGSDAAKGLNGAAPTVERRVAAEGDAYVVDYLIRNGGIDERGIPGVRVASVEGLLIETDAFGRYNLAGIDSGNAHRGRNFILKVDPSTLPEGAVLTTPNPLVRRITPGLPARFDFGVRMPAKPLEGAREQVDIVLGEVLFAPNSAELAAVHLPVIEKITERVESYGGGELVIRADGETETLALERVQSVDAAVRARLSPAAAKATRVSARLDLNEPATTVVGVQGGDVLLGTVLFDTDKSVVKPRFRALLKQVAKRLEARGGGTVAIVGHADRRASDAYNLALGLRRARAVQEAIAQELKPEVRAKVRVETLNDAPAARAGAQ